MHLIDRSIPSGPLGVLNRRHFMGAALSAVGIAQSSGLAAMVDQGAELLVYGGTIYTGRAAEKVEALLIRGGRIVFAGALPLARAQSRRAQLIDLSGGSAYPGFVDAHAHLAWLGLWRMGLDLTGSASLAEAVERLRMWASQHPRGAIKGEGWMETHWPERRYLSRTDLDAVVSDRPVFLSRGDSHAAVANSLALALGGITESTADPAGGRIERDAAGVPTGVLFDNAKDLVSSKMPQPDRAQRRAALKAAAELYASRGWTGMTDLGASWEDIELLEELAAAGELPIRVNNFISLRHVDRALARGRSTDPSGLVSVDGIKLFVDGALGSRGALLFEPYSDLPSSTGLLVTPEDQLRSVMERARRRDMQIAIHAIGDRGNHIALNLIEAVLGRGDPAKRRWRIEHAQIIAPADLPRFASLGVIASMQPSHAISDLDWAPSRLGAARLKGAYAWNSLLASGAVVAGGSDAPVEAGDPRIEYYAAAHRHDLNGKAGRNWHPEEAVSRTDALRMFTWAPAYATRRENELGTLELGKRADITIFDKDLLNIAPNEILTARTIMTIVEGIVRHSARDLGRSPVGR